jgi:hypothetical protein
MRRSAIFDVTSHYRYSLTRRWDAALPRLGFVMLNPSTADDATDDPTIRRCISFARAWGFGALEVVNLFAYRATDPEVLRIVTDPLGPNNDYFIGEMVSRSARIVVAWGIHGTLKGRDCAAMSLLGPGLHCLGVTIAGHPRHPLYIGAGVTPVPFPSVH